MSVPFNPYEILGLSKCATLEDVKKAYKRLALQYHPDKNNGDDSKFKQINEAYQILSDPIKKQLYDEHLTDENVDWSFIAKFASELMNVIKERMHQKMQERAQKEANKPCPTATPTTNVPKPAQKKAKSIFVRIQVDIKEIYNAAVKKIIVKVKRNEEGQLIYKSIPIYISLIDYENVYIFDGQGDDSLDADEVRGDIVIKLDVMSQHVPGITIDTIISKYDLHLERDMTLYEYYYGIDVNIPYYNGELITINHRTCRKQREQHTYYNFVHEIKGKGLPYTETDADGEEVEKRGDLIVFFKLILPGLDDDVLETHKNFFGLYFNGQAHSD